MSKKKKYKTTKIPWIIKVPLMGVFYFLISMSANYVYDERPSPPVETTITTTTLQEITTTENPFLLYKQSNILIEVETANAMEIGSGVIFSEDDVFYYALTCAHVIDGNGDMIIHGNVTTWDDITSSFDVVAMDEDIDLAIIRFDKDSRSNVTVITLGNIIPSTDEILVSIGNPEGVFGIVSLITFIEETTLQELDLVRSVYALEGSLDPGTSGGALFNSSGELIGITAYVLGDTTYSITLSVIHTFLNNHGYGQ